MVLISELIGSLGKYQIWLCALIFLNKFGVAFHQMAIIFLAPPAKYYCPGTNATCCDNPVYDKTKFTRTIVMEWNLICGKSWLKEFTQTSFQFGVLSGSFFFGMASDRYGRRPTLIICVILEVFTGFMTSFLPDYWSFTIIRMILGVSIGGVMVIGFVMVMEYVGSKYRDVAAALFHVPFTVGHILLALFGYLIRDYVYFQLGISLSNIVLLCYICVLPESPRWLLVRDRTGAAVALLERVAKINNLPTEDILSKVALYQLEHNSPSANKGTAIDLFRTPNLRKNIMVMSFTWLVCSYCFYGMSQYISHLTGDIYVNVMASGSVCLTAAIVSIPLMMFLPRKTLVVVANLLCSLCMLIIAVVPEGKVSIVLGCTGVFFSFMVFVVVYLYCSEMFPTVVRNAALGITSMVARVGAMIAPFVAGLRPYGKWCAPVAFGIFPLFAAIMCLLLPETKDCELMMTLEEGEAFGKKSSRPGENARGTDGVT